MIKLILFLLGFALLLSVSAESQTLKSISGKDSEIRNKISSGFYNSQSNDDIGSFDIKPEFLLDVIGDETDYLLGMTLEVELTSAASALSQNSIFQPNNLKPNYKNNEKNLMVGFGLGFEIPISNMKDRYGLMLFGNISGHNKINNDIYIGFNIFTSPEFATLFPSNTATNETGLTSICADIRYRFFTDKRYTSAYFNFGTGIYLTKDKYETTDPVNNTRLSVSPGVNLGVGLFGNISEDIILDVNSTYNLYYNSHIMEYRKYSSSKLFNYILISASLKFFM